MWEEDRLVDKKYVEEGIRRELTEVLSWTTLECDWGSVDVEIPYNLFFRSESKPWGYRYRLFSEGGELIMCNPAVRKDLELILIDLLSRFCKTKWGNSVDGRSTLYKFLPQAKRAFNS